MRRLSSDEATDVWPVIADSFLGILAVVVLLFIGQRAVVPEVARFRRQLEAVFKDDLAKGLLLRCVITSSEVRMIYSADALSFEACGWDLPGDRADRMVAHLRAFQGHADLIDRIQIEGHSDQRRVSGCPWFGPYKDNLQLSQNRARAVYNALLGMEPLQAAGLDELLAGDTTFTAPVGLEFLQALNREGKLQVAGYGATRPENRLDPTASINRRVEIVVKFTEKTSVLGARGEEHH